MRKTPSLAERLLWHELHEWNRTGLRFRRQYVISPYIVDMACPAARVVVELDGSSHDDLVKKDELRTAYLNQTGWRVLRFSNVRAISDARRAAEHVLHICAARIAEGGVKVPDDADRFLADYN